MLFSLAFVLMVGLGEVARAANGGDNVLRQRHLQDGGNSKGGKGEQSSAANQPEFGQFEVWASDQSNSVATQASRGVEGSFLWIWDSEEIKGLVNTGSEAATLPCTPTQTTGPCDMLDVFPSSLAEFNADGIATMQTLATLDNFGRLHGMLPDPTHRYVTANLFAPDGGYIGIIDTQTKEAIALFRITKFSNGRSNHMSLFSDDGHYIIISNLSGKAMERIDIARDDKGIITQVSFNKSASLGLGSSMSVISEATFFKGNGAFGNPLLGQIIGDYANADLGDLTPNSVCKENECPLSPPNAAMGGRPNNVIICPIPSKAGLAYITLGGGGLFVAEIAATPMKIVGEYGNAVVYGAGCGGVQVSDGQVFLNAGVSAAAGGNDQSMFAVQSFNDSQYPLPGSTFNPENTPMPNMVYQDTDTNTASGGNIEGAEKDETGQLPHFTTRRDSHGAAATLDGKYVHVTDRIQNVVEVFDTSTYERTTYDLTSTTGQGGRQGPAGPCYKHSVLDDPQLPLNDPTPDLMSITPDGNYLMIAFRGPVPVSVTHSAQGSCPGVGIVQLTEGGKFGKLVEVLRTTNTDDTAAAAAPGGATYNGAERSDAHAAMVVARRCTTTSSNTAGKGSGGKPKKKGKNGGSF